LEEGLELALEELSKRGYKPKKRKITVEETKVEEVLKRLREDDVKQLVLGLLVEGLSDPEPREILVYGAFVKRYLEPLVSGSVDERVVKTLKLLREALAGYFGR